jgi:hypothetical protein
MRIAQIIRENEGADDIMSALSSMATVLLAKKVTDIPTSYMVKYLNGMGYNIDADSLVSVASQSPFITSATHETVSLGNVDATDGTDQDIEQDVVGDMATSAAMGDLKQ